MKKEKKFVDTIVRLLLSHSVDIEAAASKEDVPGTLKAIEEMIADLEQIHFTIAIANDPPECAEASCPSGPESEGIDVVIISADDINYSLN